MSQSAITIPKSIAELPGSGEELRRAEQLLNALAALEVIILVPATTASGSTGDVAFTVTVPARTLRGRIRIAGSSAVIEAR